MLNKSRIEAFSDGVIAIIITVMVFDLKIEVGSQSIFDKLIVLIPKLISYIFSFLMIAIMWINHHQLFHQIKFANRRILWLNILLLFGMSLIPFVTNFIGSEPTVWIAYFCYGIVFLFNVILFTLIRKSLLQSALVEHPENKKKNLQISKKNYSAMLLYLIGAFVSLLSIKFSIILYIVVPIMYIIPQKIEH